MRHISWEKVKVTENVPLSSHFRLGGCLVGAGVFGSGIADSSVGSPRLNRPGKKPCVCCSGVVGSGVEANVSDE